MDSRGTRILELIENDKRILESLDSHVNNDTTETKETSAKERDVFLQHVGASTSHQPSEQEHALGLHSSRTDPETTPSRPAFTLFRSCRRTLFDTEDQTDKPQDVISHKPDPLGLQEDDSLAVIHQDRAPSEQNIVQLDTVEGGVGIFETLSIATNQIYNNELEVSNEQCMKYASCLSKPLVDYSDTESDYSDSDLVFNYDKFHSSSNHSFRNKMSGYVDITGEQGGSKVNEWNKPKSNYSNNSDTTIECDSYQGVERTTVNPLMVMTPEFTSRDHENTIYSEDSNVSETTDTSDKSSSEVSFKNFIRTKSNNSKKKKCLSSPIKVQSHQGVSYNSGDESDGSETQEEDSTIVSQKIKLAQKPLCSPQIEGVSSQRITSSDSGGSGSEESDTDPKNEKSRKDILLVETTCNTKVGGRVYDKKSACFYCEKLCSKLPEHLEMCHPNEMEVAKLIAKKKGSKDRRILLKTLRNKGNFLFNKAAIERNEGKILPCKRPGTVLEGGRFLPCEYCLGFYKKSSLARHVAKCPLKPDEAVTGKRKNRVAISSTLANSSPTTKFSNFFTVVLHSMRDDNVSIVARNDSLIMKYGNYLSEKYRDQEHLKYDIIQKMRELARLLQFLREEDGDINTLNEALKPKHFYILLKSVEKLAELDGSSGGKPTLALKVGYSLQKCIFIKKTEAIMQSNSKQQKLCDNFLDLYKLNWENSISKRALQRLDTATWNKPSVIPLAQDVLKLNMFIKREQLGLYNKLKSHKSTTHDYRTLVKVTLAHIIIFNRKRAGEVERLEKSTYLHRVAETPQGEIENSLSRSERLLAKSLTLLHIRGKRNRKVPLLLTPEMVKMVDLIITKQSSFSVPNNNKFIFARPNSHSCFRGSDAISYVATNSGAENVNTLTSTRLRKHIATVSQILNLSSNDLELLSRHMGHSLNVHKDFYRLPDNTLELAKVSKLLLQFDKGVIEPGQTLDTISLDLPDKDTDDECEDIHISTKSTHSVVEREPHKRAFFKPKTLKGLKKKVNVVKAPWTKLESEAIRVFFQRSILLKEVPGKKECEKCASVYPVLKQRSWVQIKSKVHNIIKSGKIM